MNDFNSAADNFSNNISIMDQKIKNLKKNIKKEIDDNLMVVFKKFFEAAPEIALITWTQYTPYFNDGDPCVFRVGDVWCVPHINMEEYENSGGRYAEEYDIDYHYGDDQYKNKVTPERFIELKNICKKVCDIIYSIDDDMKLMLWEDHVVVNITKDGITTREYEHE